MLIAVGGLVVLLVLLVLLVTSRYKVAGPNQAYIVTGRKGKAVLNPETGALTTDLSGQKVILGGCLKSFALCIFRGSRVKAYFLFLIKVALRTCIYRLRKKLEEKANGLLIETAKGYGYRLKSG